MATIDIMLPVYNEAKNLEQNTVRLRNYLDELHLFTQTVNIVIVDNASTDATPAIGRQLAVAHDGVTYLRLERKGRGHALKTAWQSSTAIVVAYMDIDLSTSLSHLPDLLWPLLHDEADISFGSRLSPGSIVAGRSTKREVLSRGYNRLLQFTMNATFADAQCGFKAIRREVFEALLPQVVDDNWFFDTELLLRAQYRGYRLRQVPVVWLDDAASTVNVHRTVIEDLRGMARVYRTERPYSALHRLASFTLIGIACTVGYALLYWLLAMVWQDQAANLITLIMMTLLNLGLNRRYTYRHVGRAQRTLHYGAGLGAFFLTWALTGGGLWLVQGFQPMITTGRESLLVTGLSLAGTILKYFIYGLIFRRPTSTASKTSTTATASHYNRLHPQPVKELA